MIQSSDGSVNKQAMYTAYATICNLLCPAYQTGMGRSLKTKLWGKLEEIKSCKDAKFGQKKYQIKLVGVAKLVWVFATDLSNGVLESHKLEEPLPKNAKVRVNRGYVETQQKFLKQVHS